MQGKAVYERASAVAGADLADSSLPEALKSDAVTKLREKYVRLAARRRELAAPTPPTATTPATIAAIRTLVSQTTFTTPA